MYRFSVLICFVATVSATIPTFAKSALPFPGIGIVPDLSLPPDGCGVFLFDIGLPISERSLVYGVSASLISSDYREEIVGVQVGTLASTAKKAYGAQFGLFNSAERGFGSQVGLVNFYNDESFRGQIGFWNTRRFSLNWNYGPNSMSGGHGVQLGFINSSSEGGHLQFGVFNFGESTSVVQIGLINIVNENTRCLQFGLVNERGADATPFFGWRW